MSPILLVTGSRALADRSEAAEWARGILRAAIWGEPGTWGPSLVLTGDARGPDAWSKVLAGHRARIYTRDGAIYVGGHYPAREGWWIEPPHPVPEPRGRAAWRTRLLARDRALVAYAALCADRGRLVRVLALRAPWSETHGTDYTVQHARAAGLRCDVLTYPEVAP